jgi:hypothetical protein
MPKVYNLRELEKITTTDLNTIVPLSADDMINLEDKRVRLTNISKAITLGNSNDFHTDLVINTTKGLVGLHTKVLSIEGETVLVKEGYGIPISCIYSLDMTK